MDNSDWNINRYHDNEQDINSVQGLEGLQKLRQEFIDKEIEIFYQKASKQIKQDNLTKVLKVLYGRGNPYIEVKF